MDEIMLGVSRLLLIWLLYESFFSFSFTVGLFALFMIKKKCKYRAYKAITIVTFLEKNSCCFLTSTFHIFCRKEF